METTNDIETKRIPALALSPYSAKPNITLAPATTASTGRRRTLFNEGEKSTPENAHGSRDEADVEDGKKTPSRGSSKDEDSQGDSVDGSIQRAKILIYFAVALLICFAVGFLAIFFSRKRRNDSGFDFDALDNLMREAYPTVSPTASPTASPTRTRPPTFQPTLSSAPTTTFQPSSSPTTSSPTVSPSAAPTISPQPTASPSAAPTQEYGALIEEFLSGDYGVDVSSGSEIATTNALAIEWLALEASGLMFVELNGYLVQRFALVAADLSLQGAKTAADAPKNAQLRINVCGWNGITCDGDGWVTGIKWDYQPKGRNGSGTISPELRLLVGGLTVLDLSNNDLVGTIPEELYKLTKLERLFLFKNNLEGTISSQIEDFDAITHFHLSHNKLSGSIPTEVKSDGDGIRPLRTWSLLTYHCQARENLETRKVTHLRCLSHFYSFCDTEYFNVYNNQLTGTLPQSMRLRFVIYFDVGRNFLTGTLPVDLGEKFVELRHLHLDHNKFRGTLPESYNTVGNGRLESFSINHNELTGVVPGKRSLYNKLVQYNLQSNNFDKMDSDVCKIEVPFGESVELRCVPLLRQLRRTYTTKCLVFKYFC